MPVQPQTDWQARRRAACQPQTDWKARRGAACQPLIPHWRHRGTTKNSTLAVMQQHQHPAVGTPVLVDGPSSEFPRTQESGHSANHKVHANARHQHALHPCSTPATHEHVRAHEHTLRHYTRACTHLERLRKHQPRCCACVPALQVGVLGPIPRKPQERLHLGLALLISHTVSRHTLCTHHTAPACSTPRTCSARVQPKGVKAPWPLLLGGPACEQGACRPPSQHPAGPAAAARSPGHRDCRRCGSFLVRTLGKLGLLVQHPLGEGGGVWGWDAPRAPGRPAHRHMRGHGHAHMNACVCVHVNAFIRVRVGVSMRVDVYGRACSSPESGMQTGTIVRLCLEAGGTPTRGTTALHLCPMRD